MTTDKFKRLIADLAKRTDAGSLRWERTPVEGLFQTALAGFVIQIFGPSGPPFATDGMHFWLTILDAGGTVISSFDLEFAPEQTEIQNTLRRIYSSARQRAMGADKAIDTILTALAER